MPEGATIFRHTHPAVWDGELADRIRAEIMRRSDTMRGKSVPRRTHRFSGLGGVERVGVSWRPS